MLVENLLVATAMIALTTCVHFFGIAALISFTRRNRFERRTRGPIWLQGASILLVVFGLIFLHTIEIWLYAGLYILLGEFSTWEEALYFSTSTFTTVGFGDIVLDPTWRLVAAIESAGGFLLIGWSTAFLVSVTARLGALEAQMVDQLEKRVENKD